MSKAIEKDGYYYDPPSFRVCDECGGTKIVSASYVDKNSSPEKYYSVGFNNIRCPKCADSPKPGWLPLHYTPEEWEAAEGILTDETLCFAYDYVEWFPQEYQFVKGFEKVIIANSVGRPEEE